jgi:adenosine deaminase
MPSEINLDLLTWPSVVTELHVHLGGSVPLYRIWEIAVDRGIRGLGNGYHEFINQLQIVDGKVHDLDSYLEVYDKVELVQSGPQAVRESVIIAIHRAYRTGGAIEIGPGGSPVGKTIFNVGKLELRFNPLKRTGAVFLKGKHAGLYDVDRIIKAACDAVEEVQLAFHDKIKVGLIFCFGRDMTYEANLALAKKTVEWSKRSKLIVGVDLAGSESVNSLADDEKLHEMKNIFELIPKDLGKTVHVGETPHVSLEVFLKTVKALNPHRIAHPIVAFRAYLNHNDSRGLDEIISRNLVCEFCVKSNLLTQAVSSLEEYGKILHICDTLGIPYTFSTDAPSLQGSSLASELLLLLSSGAATKKQIDKALATADKASFIKT